MDSPYASAIGFARYIIANTEESLVDRVASGPSVTLEMTNAGWKALKASFARFGVDVMALPFNHDAGFINSDAPLEIFTAMFQAALSEGEG